MATRKPLVKITGSPNKIQEMPGADTLDPASASLSGSFVGTTDTQTLTNKTLTAPKIATIADANGVAGITLATTASAVNQVNVVPSATGTAVQIAATGTDASVAINIVSKGGAGVQADGATLVTASNTVTLTNKTHTDPRVSNNRTHDCAIASNVPGGAVCDPDGNVIFGTLDPGTAGESYLAIRNQGATDFSSPSVVACGTPTNLHILMQPKGSGSLRVRTPSAGNANVLNTLDVIAPTDYRALSLPSGGVASAIGQQPAGMRLCSGLASDSIPVTKDILYWFPFVAPRNGAATVSLTNITLSTGAANAVASNARVGVYTTQSFSATFPGDSGTSLVTGSEAVLAMPGAASTVVASGALTASLTPGSLYWLAVVMETPNCILRCWNAEAPVIPVIGCYGEIGAAGTTLSFFGTTTQLAYTGWKAAYTYAALPANSTSAGVASLFQFTNVNAAGTPNIMALLKYGS